MEENLSGPSQTALKNGSGKENGQLYVHNAERRTYDDNSDLGLRLAGLSWTFFVLSKPVASDVGVENNKSSCFHHRS